VNANADFFLSAQYQANAYADSPISFHANADFSSGECKMHIFPLKAQYQVNANADSSSSPSIR
jgi:hypothetical protein